MEINDFYVYELTDPRTNKPFYVGKGRGDRDKKHLVEARGSRDVWVNKIKCQIINNIEANNRQVIIKRVMEGLTESAAYDLETTLIAKYGKIIDGTGILSNIADGGLGGNTLGRAIQSYTVTGALVNSYKSLCEAAKDVGVHKSTICAALNGRCALAGGYRWGYVGEPLHFFPARSGVEVDQYSISGKFVKRFPTIKAASGEVGVTFTAIVGCCRGTGNQCTAGGYRWAYAGEQPFPLPPSYKHHPKGRTLQALNKDGQVVGVYSGIIEASQKTQANPTGICDCCAGRKSTSGGLRWRWVG